MELVFSWKNAQYKVMDRISFLVFQVKNIVLYLFNKPKNYCNKGAPFQNAASLFLQGFCWLMVQPINAGLFNV